jgi:hypothetical protein
MPVGSLTAASNIEWATFVREPLQVGPEPSFRQSRIGGAQLAAALQREAPNLRHPLNHAAWQEPVLRIESFCHFVAGSFLTF